MKVYIDSNIPMYVAGGEHEHRGPALRFLERVENREIQSCTSTEVLQEVLCRYSAIARRDLGGRVYDLFVEACPEVLDVTLADLDRAKDLIARTASISARAALHAAVMMNHEIEWIATFNREFDRIAGVRRVKLA
jgi:predicted nucleic acid-binding protein